MFLSLFSIEIILDNPFMFSFLKDKEYGIKWRNQKNG